MAVYFFTSLLAAYTVPSSDAELLCAHSTLGALPNPSQHFHIVVSP